MVTTNTHNHNMVVETIDVVVVLFVAVVPVMEVVVFKPSRVFIGGKHLRARCYPIPVCAQRAQKMLAHLCCAPVVRIPDVEQRVIQPNFQLEGMKVMAGYNNKTNNNKTRMNRWSLFLLCIGFAQSFCPVAPPLSTAHRQATTINNKRVPFLLLQSSENDANAENFNLFQQVWRRTDTLEVSGINQEYAQNPPLASRGFGVKRWLLVALGAFLFKWYRARFINKVNFIFDTVVVVCVCVFS